MSNSAVVVPADAVEKTIEEFTQLDASGDKRTMNKMARKLGKEQPALLAFAAKQRADHGDKIGEAAVFYGTLAWAMFDKHCSIKNTERAKAAKEAGKTGTVRKEKLPRLTEENIEQAAELQREALEDVDGLADKPIHERVAEELVARQPHIYAKLQELIDEDVTEDAITPECAEVIFPCSQIVVEAFDAAIEGRRPGEHQGPIQRETAKVGRNEPCPCGSGKKFKKCCA